MRRVVTVADESAKIVLLSLLGTRSRPASVFTESGLMASDVMSLSASDVLSSVVAGSMDGFGNRHFDCIICWTAGCIIVFDHSL